MISRSARGRKSVLIFASAILATSVVLSSAAYAHFTSGGFDPYFYTLLHFTPYDPPIAGEPTELYLSIYNATSAEPITDLDTVHERKMHVFVVGDDFETFAHIHPEDYEKGFDLSDQGQYVLNYTFPKPGFYALLADFTYQGRTVIKEFNIFVLGSVADSFAPQRNVPSLDFSRRKEFDGYEVTLNAPESIESGKEVDLDFHIEKGGEPVTDLQQYIGAEMHLVVIKDDLTNAGHTHPYVPSHYLHIGAMAQKYYGPDLPVKYTFPTSGNYVVFGQFKHDGQVVDTKFMVKVEDSPWYFVISYAWYFLVIALVLFIFKPEILKLLGKKPKKN